MKNKEVIWIGFGVWGWGSVAEPPEDRKYFTKFLKIDYGKLKINHFSKNA